MTNDKKDNKHLEDRKNLRKLVIDAGGDRCISCGACVTGCPIADWSEERLDPRRMIRLVQIGQGELLVEQDWIWQCTNCGRCTYNCPVGVDLQAIISMARSLVPKDESPGGIQKTANLHRTISNNMNIEEEDWIDTLEWMTEELQSEIPDFELPIEKENADFFVTINSKLPMYYPSDLQDIFKIFYAAGVSWTLPKKWWEGTNYAMFTGDDETWEETLRNQVAEAERLGCKHMAYTECGHGYFATMEGYAKFGIQPKFDVTHVVKLYARWIREGRFKLDPSKNKQLITLHDPCNAVRKASMAGFESIEEDSRYVLNNIIENFTEMTPNREDNYCCSGGGGALIAGFKHARTHYGSVKVDQVNRTGAEMVCSPCVNCYDGLHNLAKDYDCSWEPIHMWKLLANAIVLDK